MDSIHSGFLIAEQEMVTATGIPGSVMQSFNLVMISSSLSHLAISDKSLSEGKN
ncbi:hypothetical protein X975_17445, partial [Stegodyphus mimosarum]